MDPEYQDIKYILLPDDRIKIAWDMIIILYAATPHARF